MLGMRQEMQYQWLLHLRPGLLLPVWWMEGSRENILLLSYGIKITLDMFGCPSPKIIGAYLCFSSSPTLLNLWTIRESSDDGILTGLLLGPLIASSLLLSSLKQMSGGATVLPAGWLIETPVALENSHTRMSPSQAILLSRYSLVDLSTLCSTILLFHVCASWWVEKKCRKDGNKPEGERASVPRSAGIRFWYYIIFTLTTSAVIVGLKITLNIYQINLWNCKSLLHIIFKSNHHSIRCEHI